jgi:hypothetical protein
MPAKKLCDYGIIVVRQAARRKTVGIKDRLKSAIDKLRNPERSEDEAEFMRRLATKRLFLLLPFVIAAVIMLLIAFK